ncbi:GntR family transcriptional regulator [Streptomyces morookaense]|uniref:GntR family transcriptional regulator n=1 Tax=Streptomyces morookaense TaxID=1970 RepID=A0A7Y7B404_STRMO|nr:GntR family transcriptional regulator [Streptomyces morookaense]NVK78475.1 GntR family transcriptional regulator [Streptomyces morookaense]GHF32644.1 GntR family transcriptional regulator [Streptomyces morookaense]
MPMLKYEQIADSLRRRITEGEFAPGDLLPSGRDLCEQWGVSRATVNKAFDVLRADGVVVARQGLGFRVTEMPVARPAGGRRAERTRVSDGRPFRRLGTPAREVPPAHVVEALGLGPGESALRRDRMMLLDDGSPLSLVSAWFPPDIADRCPKLEQAGPIAEGTTHYVTRETGRAPVRGADTATVRLATAAEAVELGRECPLAVAVDLHVAYDRAGLALVCEEGVTPPELWERVDNYPMSAPS